MPSSVSGQDNQILRCDWLSCPLGTARRVLQEKFPRKSENFSDFCKVLSQFAFRNMIVPLPKSQTRHPARARAPLHLPHRFFDEKGFYQIFPLFPIVIIPNCYSGISSRHVVFVRRLGDLVSARKTANRGGVCKV